MSIKIYDEIYQGTDEWHDVRRGILTASEMKHVLTPTLKTTNNDKSRAHLFELAAQRISQYTEPTYIGDDMLRGCEDEIRARVLYDKHYSAVKEVGFITKTVNGVTVGYSPDGLVGDNGLIEIKSRRQKFHVETVLTNEVPVEYVMQLQTGLYVTEREWIDYVSYSGGLPMWVIRVYQDYKIQAAIYEAAVAIEEKITEMVSDFVIKSASNKAIPTERAIIQEMF